MLKLGRGKPRKCFKCDWTCKTALFYDKHLLSAHNIQGNLLMGIDNCSGAARLLLGVPWTKLGYQLAN